MKKIGDSLCINEELNQAVYYSITQYSYGLYDYANNQIIKEFSVYGGGGSLAVYSFTEWHKNNDLTYKFGGGSPLVKAWITVIFNLDSGNSETVHSCRTNNNFDKKGKIINLGEVICE